MAILQLDRFKEILKQEQKQVYNQLTQFYFGLYSLIHEESILQPG